MKKFVRQKCFKCAFGLNFSQRWDGQECIKFSAWASEVKAAKLGADCIWKKVFRLWMMRKGKLPSKLRFCPKFSTPIAKRPSQLWLQCLSQRWMWQMFIQVGGQQMAFQVWTVGLLYLATNGLKSPYSLFLWRCCKFWGTWVSSCFAATNQHQDKQISPRQKKEFRHVSLACALKWSISKNIVEEYNYWQLA